MPTRATLLCLLLTACSPTLGEVKEQNKALIAQTQKRIELVRRALVGARDDVDPACKPPTPLHPGFDEAHDVEVMSFGAVERAGAEHDAYATWTEVPIYGDSALATVLQDSHPTMEKFRPPSMKVTSDLWRAAYQHAAKVKYLVVVRTRAMDRDAGTASLVAYLVEFSDAPKVLCTLTDEVSVGAKLGTSDYQVVRENRKTGEKTVVRSDSHDNFEEAMSRKRDQFGEKLKTAWGIGLSRK
ncbi:MAG: hypothetical protein Q8L14_40515 [Myxococcales bacterium]|nr:hypothetical protein [Myxococcales bacterium]